MIPLWHIITMLHIERHRCHDEFFMSFHSNLLSKVIESEEFIPVVRIVDHIGSWQATKLNYFKHLIIVVFTRKDRSVNE